MAKVRIFFGEKKPNWAHTYFFIDNIYKDNIRSFEYKLSVGEIKTLEITFINENGELYTNTYDEIKDNIMFNSYTKFRGWRDILIGLR